MAKLNAGNNSQTLLDGAITDTDTSMTVLDGSIFPDTPFAVTIEDEIIYVGAKSGNIFSSLLRGQEGTAAAAHAKEVSVENRMTAGMYNALATQEEVDNKLAQKQNNIGYTPENIANKGVANGYASLDSNTKIPLSQLPDTAKQQTYVVNSGTERNALSGLIEGDKCFEVSTGDSYIWNGTEWLISAKADWENVNLQWGNIIDKPNSTVANIDDAVDKKHEHNNLTLLQNITQTLVDRWNTVTDKVDKVTGKGLSTEDYTTDEKNKLSGIATGANNYTHPTSHPASMITESSTKRFVSDAEKNTWNTVTSKADLTYVNTELNKKVDKISGKGLSTEDYTSAEKTKLSGIEAGAEVNQNAFSNIKVGTTTIAADSKTDTLELTAGTGITLTPDATNDKVTVSVASAPKLTTARTISLSGDVSGSTSFNGSANVTITATVADDSHNHVISNIDGLQAALDAKETPTGAQAKVDAHANLTNNPHSVTKSQVGLGSVSNYGLATQAEAEAGTSSAKYMTPLRTKQAINALQAVKSVAGKTGTVTLTKGDVGLSNVDNTSDANKPISTATQTALNNKVDKITGKGLSTEDYTTAEKTKLAGVETGANNYTHPSTHSLSMITETATEKKMTSDERNKLVNIEENANNYVHPTTSGNKHIPTGGTVGQILKNTASGTATWADETDTITTINGKTGAISKADIVALGIPASDTNTTYAEITTAEIDAGTSSTLRTITARRLKYLLDKIVALFPTKTSELTNDSGFLTSVTKSDVGLSNVDNVKQMPISGGVLENYREKLVTLSGTSTAINLSLGNVFTHSLTGNTTYSITNAVSGQAHSFTLIINMGSTVRTLTFPASVKWQGGEIPDMTTASKTYVLTFMTIDGGTNWLGMFGGEF